MQHNVLEVWGPSGPWLLDGGPLGSSAHTLDWCAFALDGLKNVTNQRADGQGISWSMMVKDKYTKPCHRQNKKTNQTKKAKQTKNIWDLSPPLRLLRHTLINLLKRFPTFISYQSSIVNHRWSIINHQLSIINYQLSITIINYQLSISSNDSPPSPCFIFSLDQLLDRSFKLIVIRGLFHFYIRARKLFNSTLFACHVSFLKGPVTLSVWNLSATYDHSCAGINQEKCSNTIVSIKLVRMNWAWL